MNRKHASLVTEEPDDGAAGECTGEHNLGGAYIYQSNWPISAQTQPTNEFRLQPKWSGLFYQDTRPRLPFTYAGANRNHAKVGLQVTFNSCG